MRNEKQRGIGKLRHGISDLLMHVGEILNTLFSFLGSHTMCCVQDFSALLVGIGN